MTDVDFQDWRIYILGAGVSLVGRLREDTTLSGMVEYLSPVYELRTQVVPGPPPKVAGAPQAMAIARTVFPLLMCSVRKCVAPSGCASVAMTDMPASVQREIAAGIRGAEELIQQMRAGEAGLVVSKEMPR